MKNKLHSFIGSWGFKVSTIALPILLLLFLNTNYVGNKYFERLKAEVNRIPDNYPKNFFEDTVVLDTQTECAALSIGISSEKDNVFKRTFIPLDIWNCNIFKKYLIDGDESNFEYVKYGRFWHGYQLFTKPLIIIGGVDFYKKNKPPAFLIFFIFLCSLCFE
jgi:hypothetical protein